MTATIEQKVASTLLNKEELIKVGDASYNVASPSFSTIVEISSIISTLPHIKANEDNFFVETLNFAKDCKPIGDIIATLIIGYKGLKDAKKKKFWQKQSLYDKIKEDALNLNVEEIHKIINSILEKMNIGGFFALTTSLIEINVLKRTTEEVGKTTVSGR